MLPQVLEASVDFFTLNNAAYESLASANAPAETTACTPAAVSDVLAVEACARVLYHESAPATFMFAGPSRLSLSLAKTDTFDKYALSYAWREADEEEEGKEGMRLGSVRLALDTPGSVRSHRTSLDLVADAEAWQYLRADFRMPYRSVEETFFV